MVGAVAGDEGVLSEDEGCVSGVGDGDGGDVEGGVVDSGLGDVRKGDVDAGGGVSFFAVRVLLMFMTYSKRVIKSVSATKIIR